MKPTLHHRHEGLSLADIALGIFLAIVGWCCYIAAYAAFIAFCAGGD